MSAHLWPLVWFAGWVLSLVATIEVGSWLARRHTSSETRRALDVLAALQQIGYQDSDPYLGWLNNEEDT